MATGTTRRTSLNTLAKEGLLWPKITDPDTLSADLHAIARALENDAETGQGKLSERPVAALRGRFFYVTEGAEKGLWWDTGSTWVKPEQVIEANQMAASSITAANKALASESVVASNIKAKEVGDAAIATNRILVTTNNAYGAEITYSKAECEAGVEASATRPAFVSIRQAAYGELSINGVTISPVCYEEAAPHSAGYAFLLPPGKKWKTAVAVQSSTILL